MRAACEELSEQRANDKLFAQMYGLSDFVAGNTAAAYRRTGSSKSTSRAVGNELDKFKFNICRSVVDTAQAHIASKRPKPKFQTDDADWTLVQQAQGCEQAVKGIFGANNMYGLGAECFVDASVTSIGGVLVYSEDGAVKIERIFPGELVVDPSEGYYQNPRTIHRVKFIDRSVLEETFETEVKGSTVNDRLGEIFDDFGRYRQVGDEKLIVIESWRIGPRVRDADGKWTRKGKHTICTSSQTLLDEDFTRDRFPIVVFRFSKRQAGFYGLGLVERLRGYQRALNYLNLKIADAMHRNSRSNVLLGENRDGQTVKLEHVDNDPATILKVPTGSTFQQLTANGVPTEWFAYQDKIIEMAYAEIGYSMMAATGQVPRGLESGVALREAEDIGSRRFSTVVQQYEQFFVDVARVCIDELRAISESGEAEPISVTVRRGSRARVEMINWSDVALDDHKFTLEVTPASSLPDSTAGRTATVIDWMNAGLCTPQEAKALLDHPDLERFKSLDLAAYEVVLDTIERIIEDGDYYPPEPTDDLELALKLATQSYSKFRLRRVPQAKLDLLLEYLGDVQHLMSSAATAAPQTGPTGGPVQPALPGAASAPVAPAPPAMAA